MAKKYNHKNKASNRGDIVKHIFLYLLRGCIYKYADVHSGYYSYSLSNEFNRFKKMASGLDLDGYFKAQSNGYLSSHALMKHFNPCSLVMYLFDICSEVTDSLRQEYAAWDEIHIFNYAATKLEIAKYRPEFVLLDPPGFKSKSNPKYPCVTDDILPLLESVFELQHSSAMMWIPLTKSLSEKRMIPSEACQNNVSLLGDALCDEMVAFSVDFKDWNQAIGTFIGCNIYLSSNMYKYANKEGIDLFGKMSEICMAVGWDFKRLF